jgi:hypothetical protein
MTAQERFEAALAALAASASPEYDIDIEADALRIKRTGDTYSWAELPEHVRDYWRETALASQAESVADGAIRMAGLR